MVCATEIDMKLVAVQFCWKSYTSSVFALTFQMELHQNTMIFYPLASIEAVIKTETIAIH